MNHLNYCRQIAKMCATLLAVPSLPKEKAAQFLHIADLCRASQKFLLPEGGILLADPELRGIDDTAEIHLPHEFTALEYEYSEAFDDGKSAKVVLFCREYDSRIWIKPALYSAANGTWMIPPEVVLPTQNVISRDSSGRIINVVMLRPTGVTGEEFDHHGYGSFCKVVLSLVNALSCSNVKVERSEAGGARKAMKKGALPFDDYHILTIDTGGKAGGSPGAGGSHRSPREHIRRGHIRRYESGLKVWVNATMVNPGIGGKVHKDYMVTA